MSNALTTKAAGTSLEPQTLTEAMRFAEVLADSTMVPKDYQGKPANVLVSIQWGRELGLGPMQALQNISVINGRPAVWGDAALALVLGSPACQDVAEGVEGEGDARAGFCTAARKGKQPQTRRFSVADAKKAGLWGKAGPWQQYPDRMLQLRARGFALRDVFPDVLRGIVTAEEAQDTPADPMPPARGPVVDAKPEPPQPEPVKLPVLSPDGEIIAVQPNRWLMAVERALAKLEDHGAARAWRDAMLPLLDSIAEQGGAGLRDGFHRLVDERFAALEGTFGGPGAEADR